MAMEGIQNWCCNTSGSRSMRFGRQQSRSYMGMDDADDEFSTRINYIKVTRSSSKQRWRVIWRRIKKEKKKIFNSTLTSPVQVSYDPYSYLKNFDQGSACSEPDNLSRSFSARFADPSKIFQNMN
ncbi:hypothetical protein BVC80_1487g14 [Macleaya cordata]|uniref:Uncharacterized protein n=1 Tax=Macleaya cordata TaxID=56857 RepID=A0A200QNP7_MACCD|nr:hypothetical protein BVC80_1487g14 [Macleaya cordata]